MKTNIPSTLTRLGATAATALAITAAALLPASSFGAQIFKDPTTTDLNNLANWSTTNGATTPDPVSFGTGDQLRFNENTQASGTFTTDLSGALSVGDITVDSGTGGGGSATANFVINSANSSTLTLNKGGNTSYTSAGIVLNSSSGGTLTINAAIALGASQRWLASRGLTVNGSVGIGANTLNLEAFSSATITIGGAMTATGAGGITIGSSSTGTYTLVSGGSITTGSGGTLTLGNGSTGNTFNVNSGASVNVGALNNSYRTDVKVDGTMTVSGLYTVATNATSAISGTGTINGTTFTMGNANTVVNFTNTGAMNMTTSLDVGGGSGTPGSIAFNQSAGTINTANLILGDTNAAGSRTYSLTGGRINIGSGGITAGSGASTKAINLGAGTVGARADWASSLNMALTDAATGTTFNTLDSVDGSTARNVALSGVLSGAGALKKSGAGTLTLGGANTYTGATNVSAGTLAVNGSLAAGSAVTVASGATLSGTGTVNGATTVSGALTGSLTLANDATINSGATAAASAFNGNIVNNGTISSAVTVGSGKTLSGTGTNAAVTTTAGTVSPGNSIGTLNTGNLSVTSSGAHLAMELGSTTAGTTSEGYKIVSSDRVNVTGTVDITGSDLHLLAVGTPALNDVFFLVINDGADAVSGQFGSYFNGTSTVTGTLAEGSTLTYGSQDFRLTYTANYEANSLTGGNDIALQAVPEPGTWAMMLGGLGMLIGYQRSRSRSRRRVM